MDDSGHLGGVEGWDESKVLAEMHGGDMFVGDEDVVDGAAYGYSGTGLPPRQRLMRKWAVHRRLKQKAQASNRPNAVKWNRAQMAKAFFEWKQAHFQPYHIRVAVQQAGMMGGDAGDANKAVYNSLMAESDRLYKAGKVNEAREARNKAGEIYARHKRSNFEVFGDTSIDPRATILDPRFWFKSKHARTAARDKILAQKSLARALKVQADEAAAANQEQEARALMEQSRATWAQASDDEQRFKAAEKAAAVQGYFGSDEDRLAGAQNKEWESKVAADLAAKARVRASSGGVSEREAAVLGLEADAHEARARLCGAEAKAICGETVSSIMGDDDALGTWAVVGRGSKVLSSPGAKFALKAAEATPLGMQVRAGRKVAKMAEKDPRVRKKVKELHAKAKAGSPVAKKKLGIIRAGKAADDHKKVVQTAEMRALRKDAAVKRRKAARARFRLVKFGVPSVIAAKISRHGRKKKLEKTVAVVRTARHSRNPIARKRAQGKIKAVQAKAAAGDPKAQQTAKRIVVADAVVKNTKSAADQKRYGTAVAIVNQAKLGDPAAKEKIATVSAKAAAGDPKSGRAMEALVVAAAAESHVSKQTTTSIPLTPEQREKFRPLTRAEYEARGQRFPSGPSDTPASWGIRDPSASWAQGARLFITAMRADNMPQAKRVKLGLMNLAEKHPSPALGPLAVEKGHLDKSELDEFRSQSKRYDATISTAPLPAVAVPPIPGDKKTAAATAAAAVALGVPAAAAAGAVMKAKAGDPVARAKIDQAHRVHEAARKGDPVAKAKIAAVAKGVKRGDPRAQSAAVALAAAVGIKKGRATGMAAPPALRPHVATVPEAPAEVSRPRFSALIQLGPVPGSPFRRYYSGIQRRRRHVAA